MPRRPRRAGKATPAGGQGGRGADSPSGELTFTGDLKFNIVAAHGMIMKTFSCYHAKNSSRH
jgi:hypothetical protein